MTSTPPDPMLYFGYGSNLWKTQMRTRCPASTHRGAARLQGYRWIINDRGYANVVPTPSAGAARGGHEDVVWGLVYALTPADERALDLNEGVPVAYTKEKLGVEFWPAGEDRASVGAREGRAVEMLVYIDRRRTEAHAPREEYVYRMNRGIRDAVAEGVPGGYVDGVLRKFIPESVDGAVEGLAMKQAERFEEEGGS